MDARNKIHII